MTKEEAIASVVEEAKVLGQEFLVEIHQDGCQGFGDDDKCTCKPDVITVGGEKQ